MSEPRHDEAEIDFDMPADIETEDNPHRDPETGEPLPADDPEDGNG